MRSIYLAAAFLVLPLQASDKPRPFPLWDGRESVESYAKKINLPPEKSLDLGNGVTLDLVLIPAGEFMMGTPAPPEPAITYESAYLLIGIGAMTMLYLVELLVGYWVRTRKISYSLRWLMIMMAACGLFIGGIARASLAKEQAGRYEEAKRIYDQLPAVEKPAHLERILKPFYMGKYTVTQAQYFAVMRANRSQFKGARLPVEGVSLGNALDFCLKLGHQLELYDGTNIQLPTEIQWEFACRAGTKAAFNTGDLISTDEANFAGGKPLPFTRGPGVNRSCTTPVGSFKPNAFGLYDMHGNVWQWCVFDPFADTDPLCALRGGSWETAGGVCRSARRKIYGGNSLYTGVGLRIILTVPPR